MNSLNGFIKLHRKLVAWGWYQDYVVKDVFLHLLLTASFKESKWQNQVLKPGQLITSYKRLSEDLGFSVRQVRTAINKLKSTGEIATEATSKYTVITVVNWEEYQLFDCNETSKKTSKKANKRQASDKQTTSERQHRNNVNNIQEGKYKKENIKEKSQAQKPWEALGMTEEEYVRIANQ